MNKLIIVAIGGAIGAVARYWLGGQIDTRWPMSFPLGTSFINLTGSFIIGFFMGLVSQRATLHPHWRLLIVAGFVGAYTTFSTFEYETLQLIEKGQAALALFYVTSSVLIGFIAVWFGTFAARLFAV